MFGLFKRAPAPTHEAAERTDLPLSPQLTMMMAQELPILDSVSRVRVYEILRSYEGPTIETQDQLPQEIKDLMDLN